MKRLLLLTSCLSSSAALAADLAIGRLPECGYADTETSTNIPFAFVRQGVKNFEFDLCLVGTPSNCVQLAFGRDADSDGVLSAVEADMVFGWDCGEWRLVNTTNGTVLTSAPATTNLVKDLRWNLRVRRGCPMRLDLTENGAALFSELTGAPERWFYTSGWNLVRLTVRGVDTARENARVRLNIVGYVLDLR